MSWYGTIQNASVSRFFSTLELVNDRVPPLRSLTSAFAVTLLGSLQYVLGLNSPVAKQKQVGAAGTCSNPQLSCHNTSAIEDLCCFNAPGGVLLQTQFWDTNPVTGPSDSWTIHGLWPDNCDGTYDASCDDSRSYTNITRILKAFGETSLLNYMHTYWVSDSGSAESFWEHEWSKHGTCVSTLRPTCYPDYKPTEEVPDFFNRTVSLFQDLPSFQWLKDAGITPSSSATYTFSQIQAALSKNHGDEQVYLGCRGGALNEIWYFFNVNGSVQSGQYEPAAPVGSSSTCPSTGIKYLPKSSGGSTTSLTTRTGPSGTTTAQPTSTGPAFSSSGYLNVITSGSKKGCIISKGTWYTTGTCATFRADSTGDEFMLQSSKGDCAVVNGALACGATVSGGTTFSANGQKLVYNGKETFYADAVPSESTQVTVFTDRDGHEVSFNIEWHGK